MCLEWATILFACENEKRVVFKVQNKDEWNLPNFRAHDVLSLSPIVSQSRGLFNKDEQIEWLQNSTAQE